MVNNIFILFSSTKMAKKEEIKYCRWTKIIEEQGCLKRCCASQKFPDIDDCKKYYYTIYIQSGLVWRNDLHSKYTFCSISRCTYINIYYYLLTPPLLSVLVLINFYRVMSVVYSLDNLFSLSISLSLALFTYYLCIYLCIYLSNISRL